MAQLREKSKNLKVRLNMHNDVPKALYLNFVNFNRIHLSLQQIYIYLNDIELYKPKDHLYEC